jgi:phospholipid/cholesterol/gamma-HCH transport system substrate-binding protein
VNISREFKVGAVAVLALASLYWGIAFLKGSDLLKNTRIIYAVYDHIDELSKARPVNINGFKVGQVEHINFLPDGSGRILVSLNITNDIRIPKNTIAKIYSSDLIGNKAVELIMGDSPLQAEIGDTLKSKIQRSLTEEVNEQVRPIKEKAEKLLGSVDTVLTLVSGFLNEDTKQSFTKTFQSVQQSFATLKNTVSTLDRAFTSSEKDLVSSINNLAKITAALEGNQDNLNSIFKNLESISDSLSDIEFKRVIGNLNKTLEKTNSIMTKVDSGSGTASQLINDPQLYQNLVDATEQLNLILLDLKHNPKRYVNISVFGSSKKYDEEEILEKEAEAKKKREEFKLKP